MANMVLQIDKMPDGGYIVGDSVRPGEFRCQRFASTSLEEALKYIKTQMEPKPRSAM